MGEFMRIEDLQVYNKLCQLHIEVCQMSHQWLPEERFELGEGEEADVEARKFALSPDEELAAIEVQRDVIGHFGHRAGRGIGDHVGASFPAFAGGGSRWQTPRNAFHPQCSAVASRRSNPGTGFSRTVRCQRRTGRRLAPSSTGQQKQKADFSASLSFPYNQK